MMKQALLAFLALTLAGLSHAENVFCDPGKKESDGLIIFSIVLADQDRVYGSPETLMLGFRPQGQSAVKRAFPGLTTSWVGIQRRWMFKSVASHFPDVFGRVYALRVAAGDYEFTGWKYTQLGSKLEYFPLDLPPRKFSVAAGSTIYLGSFDATHSVGTTFVKWSGVLNLADAHERDLSAFRAQCAGEQAPDLKLLDAGPWAAGQARDLPANVEGSKP